MTAKIYRYADFSTEPSREKLVPLEVLDQLPLEERLPALQRHFDALDEHIAREYKKTAVQLRRLRKAQSRFRKHMREHAQATHV
jgi:hypothetical protein